ncbi:RagB/SusD family nutrient uptake outer membrane protein [Bacteroides sp.]|uniref:RagB/SusD family nutrient uptake outer membrane protein n=1 Tax=Bacteroides sp. TaxID=29523 RepID=UPI00262A02EB|nr:RagB/SusD family nutrient uptake outer membrane protein [Bacteroides sp.]
MKLKFKYITFSALLCVSVSSCDLDVIPPSDIATETFWKTDKDAWAALNGLYAELSGMDIWDEMCTDNAHSHKPWEGPYELVQTNGITAGDDNWNYSYSTIRVANTFILNVDQCDMDEKLKERMKAEARFFRAWRYLELTLKFGKAYIFTDVPDYNVPNVPRDPVEKVREFILTELKQIADILPDSYDDSEFNEASRITRAAALSLRARAALYFGNYAEAEASANLVISEGHHSLFRVTALNAAQTKEAAEMDKYIDFDHLASLGVTKEKFMLGLFSYETLWHKENASPTNPEYILTREYMADDNNNDWTRYTYIRPSQMGSGYSSFEPMQDLIDAYWDIDGKTVRPKITEENRRAMYSDMWMKYFTTTGKDKDGRTTYASISPSTFRAKVPELELKSIPYMNEFLNRDSRLYASILFPLKGWQETDFTGDFYYMWDPFKVGDDGNESWTGYSYRKLVSLTAYQGWASVEDYPLLRYAEVLLTFAEARVMNKGWDDEARKAINDLRDRCGMPDAPVSLSKDAALELVRNERRIELAAEGHRFDDIRRYGVEYCREVMNGESTAPCGGFDVKEQKWNKYVVIDKTWGDRLLLMPIPTGAMDVNPLLKDDQNPGY